MKYFAILFATILFFQGIAAVLTIALTAILAMQFTRWYQGQRISILVNAYSN